MNKILVTFVLLGLFFSVPAYAGLKAVAPGYGNASNMTVTPTGSSSPISLADFAAQVGSYKSCSSVGLVGDGTTDMTTALPAAIDDAVTDGYVLYCEPSDVFKITSPIVNSANAAIFWNGATIDATSMGSSNGNLVTIKPTVAPTATDNILLGQSGLILNCPTLGSSGTNTCLYMVENPSIYADMSNFVARDFHIHGGSTGLAFGARTYLITFDNIMVSGQYSRGVDLTTVSGAGERMLFKGGVIANVRSTSGSLGNGVGVYSGANSSVDAYLSNTSVDYCDKLVDWNGGRLKADGHLEGDGTHPMVRVNAASSSATVVLDGAQLVQAGPLIGPYPEPSGGRPYLIDIANGWAEVSTSGTQFTYLGTEGNYNTAIFNPAGSAANINHSGISVGKGANANSKLPSMGSISELLIGAGNFDSASTPVGWKDSTETNYYRNSAFVGAVAATNVAITSLTTSGTTVTALVPSTAGLAVNDWVVMNGQSPAAFSGALGFVKITGIVANTSFTYECAACSGTATTAGTYTNHGSIPSEWTISYPLGLSYQVVSVDNSTTTPTLSMRVYGTASSSGNYTINHDNLSTPLPTKKYDSWKFVTKARLVSNTQPAKSLMLMFTERTSGNIAVTSGSATKVMKSWFEPATLSYTITDATTAYVNFYVNVNGITSGYDYDQTFEITAPEIVQSSVVPTYSLASLTSSASSTQPSGRYGIDTSGTNSRSGNNALHVWGTGANDFGPLYYKLDTPKGGSWVHARCWFKTANYVSGTVGLKYEEYDSADNLISSGSVDSAGYNSAGPTSYTLYSGIVQVHKNTSYVRIIPWTHNLNGEVYFDDCEATVM